MKSLEACRKLPAEIVTQGVSIFSSYTRDRMSFQ